jgi:anthranilate phosphoribosyltransferase
VIPSYNGARKLPVLTPLLALLLARQGLPVAIHGTATEDKRVFTSEVLAALGIVAQQRMERLAPGQVTFYPTGLLLPGLQRLLDVRRVIGLRNPAHSLVKLLLPCSGPQVLVTSFTHPEYAESMAQVLGIRRVTALLLRGTEGEAVADPRRQPTMRCFVQGQPESELEHQAGALTSVPDLPACDALSTADYIRSVLDGTSPLPQPIALQVKQIVKLAGLAEIPGVP